MKDKIKVLLADDHAIVRMGLASLLGTKPDIKVVGEASNGEETVELAQRKSPDVVLMDLMMPHKNGVDATAELHERMPNIKVLILTMFGTSPEIADALAAGATGALMKSVAKTDLVSAIRRVAAGERVLSPEIEQMLEEDSATPALSPRQRNILESISRGLTNNEISAQLDISLGSVKTHIERIFAKIGATTRAEAISIALRRRLIATSDHGETTSAICNMPKQS